MLDTVEELYKRIVKIRLPQMAFQGLSENWLLKELGDIHWQMISNGMELETTDIKDENGNRLYASFVRVKYESDNPLSNYAENKNLMFEGTCARYGRKIYTSQITVRSEGLKGINAKLMTVFVASDQKTNELKIRNPAVEFKSKVQKLDEMSELYSEYVAEKKSFENAGSIRFEKMGLSQESIQKIFNSKRKVSFKKKYEINPYTDLNGYNLLYFASYMNISDSIERNLFNSIRGEFNIRGDWALSTSVLSRDIFYYGNCALNEDLNVSIDLIEFLQNGKLRIHSSIYKINNGQLIAKIDSLKTLI